MSQQSKPVASAPPRFLVKLFTRTHVLFNRLTGGLAFNTMRGDEVCFVTMTGAKSGRQLTIPMAKACNF